MPWMPSVLARRIPWSSDGKNPFFTCVNMNPATSSVTAENTSITGRCCITQPSEVVYNFNTRWYSLSNPSKMKLCDPCRLFALRKCAPSIGVSVSDTKPDTRIATAMVTANSRNRRPTMPPMNSSGMNTAVRLAVIEMIVNPISAAPSSAACMGGFPISMWRTMFSSITIASSTTKPTARVSAISERLSRL